jgi:hypothetical protein
MALTGRGALAAAPGQCDQGSSEPSVVRWVGGEALRRRDVLRCAGSVLSVFPSAVSVSQCCQCFSAPSVVPYSRAASYMAMMFSMGVLGCRL